MEEAACPALAYKKSSLQLSVFPVAIVFRPCVDPSSSGSGTGYQILIFSNDKDALFGSNSRSCIFELVGNDATGQFRLAAEPLELKERGPDGELRPYSCQVALHRAVYDSYSRAVYFVEGRALMRLGPDNVVSPLAGHREVCGATDGPGPSARFQLPHSLVSDGAGRLYVADCGSVRRVTLPPPLTSTGAGAAAAAAPPPGPSALGAQRERQREEAVVTTIYGGPGSVVDVTYDTLNCRLFAAKISAVYQVSEDGRAPLRVAGWEAAAAGGGPSGAGGRGGGTATARGLSSMSYHVGSASGSSGGGGAGAALSRFSSISGLVSDCDGGLLVTDRHQVFRLEAEGGREYVICLGKSDTSWGAVGCYPVILPNGWLALCQYHDRRLLLLQLGLGLGLGPRGFGFGFGFGLGFGAAAAAAASAGGGALCPSASASSATCPRSHPWQVSRAHWQWQQEGVGGLVGDLASLLADPDGSDDVEVVAGERRFRCHRLILGARCLYFRRLFAGGFADSGARQVVLQDADPDAFEALLRFLYTGDMAFPPHLLRPVAELADRLLLTQVVSHVHARLLSAAQPASVVADMLWAHQQGFEDLLAGLKEWYLRHQAEVLAAAGDSVRQLFVSAPTLMYDLHCATVRQTDRRRCSRHLAAASAATAPANLPDPPPGVPSPEGAGRRLGDERQWEGEGEGQGACGRALQRPSSWRRGARRRLRALCAEWRLVVGAAWVGVSQ